MPNPKIEEAVMLSRNIFSTTCAIMLIAAGGATAQSNDHLANELWGAKDCHRLAEVMAFDHEIGDRSLAEYAEAMNEMSFAYGFLHGYAVANGWHEWPDFNYVADFRDECEGSPGRPPLMILIHLF